MSHQKYLGFCLTLHRVIPCISLKRSDINANNTGLGYLCNSFAHRGTLALSCWWKRPQWRWWGQTGGGSGKYTNISSPFVSSESQLFTLSRTIIIRWPKSTTVKSFQKGNFLHRYLKASIYKHCMLRTSFYNLPVMAKGTYNMTATLGIAGR